MKGKEINAKAKKDIFPHIKKGDNVKIITILRDEDTVILRESKPSKTNTQGPFWDEIVAQKGTYKGYNILLSNGNTLGELLKPLYNYFDIIH